MVKRYPHTAIVTMSAKGQVVDGELVPGIPVEISVSGRYDPVSDGESFSNVIRLVMKRKYMAISIPKCSHRPVVSFAFESRIKGY